MGGIWPGWVHRHRLRLAAAVEPFGDLGGRKQVGDGYGRLVAEGEGRASEVEHSPHVDDGQLCGRDRILAEASAAIAARPAGFPYSVRTFTPTETTWTPQIVPYCLAITSMTIC